MSTRSPITTGRSRPGSATAAASAVRSGRDDELVERRDHGDMGEPARPAAAEREREGLHAPASCANRHAVAASGATMAALAGAYSLVAVPSRTRPTMPWKIAARRKKL